MSGARTDGDAVDNLFIVSCPAFGRYARAPQELAYILAEDTRPATRADRSITHDLCRGGFRQDPPSHSWSEF